MEKKIVDLGEALLGLTTKEAILLQEYLESKGLQMVQAVPVATAAAPIEEEAKESEFVNVVMTQTGSLVKVAKALMPVTGKTASQIKELVATIPAVIMEKMPRDAGKALVSELNNIEGLNDFFTIADA